MILKILDFETEFVLVGALGRLEHGKHSPVLSIIPDDAHSQPSRFE